MPEFEAEIRIIDAAEARDTIFMRERSAVYDFLRQFSLLIEDMKGEVEQIESLFITLFQQKEVECLHRFIWTEFCLEFPLKEAMDEMRNGLYERADKWWGIHSERFLIRFKSVEFPDQPFPVNSLGMDSQRQPSIQKDVS